MRLFKYTLKKLENYLLILYFSATDQIYYTIDGLNNSFVKQ